MSKPVAIEKTINGTRYRMMLVEPPLGSPGEQPKYRIENTEVDRETFDLALRLEEAEDRQRLIGR